MWIKSCFINTVWAEVSDKSRELYLPGNSRRGNIQVKCGWGSFVFITVKADVAHANCTQYLTKRWRSGEKDNLVYSKRSIRIVKRSDPFGKKIRPLPKRSARSKKDLSVSKKDTNVEKIDTKRYEAKKGSVTQTIWRDTYLNPIV